MGVSRHQCRAIADNKDSDFLTTAPNITFSTMTSTSQLRLCLNAKGTLSQIKGSWIHHNASTGNQVQVRYNKNNGSASYSSICITREKKGWCTSTDPHCCNAHLKCDGSSREDMSITSICLEHTCGSNGNVKSRKRNYRM